MPIRLSRLLPPALAALPLLGGCAAQGDFPSLAPRAVEREFNGIAAPVNCPGAPCAKPSTAEAPPPPVNPDPGLGARVAELLSTARQGQAEFAKALPRANGAAARGGAPGSENWIVAQQEISRLEAARARTVDALAELDALAVRRGDAPVAEADYRAVLAAAEEVRTLAQAQQAELDRLAGSLSAP